MWLEITLITVLSSIMYIIYNNNNYIALTEKLILSEKDFLLYEGHENLYLNFKNIKEMQLFPI